MNQTNFNVAVRRIIALSLAALTTSVGSAVNAQSESDSTERLNRHAIIIGVGRYTDPLVPALRGVVHDISNAKRMAQSMGVPQANVTVLQDDSATYANIRHTIRELGKRVRDGDRVFIYYSGHGTRVTVPDSPSQCREALIPVDTQVQSRSPLLTQEDIAEDLAPIYAKADKVFVFFDACHSGGVKAINTRSASAGNAVADLFPKFAAIDSAAHCSVPSNVRTRSVVDVAGSRGALPKNVVQLSSSRPDEISFDSPATGGLATEAWRNCSIYADDLDGSGSLSVAEIARCVQQRIDVRLKDQPMYSGQNIVISGNTAFAPIHERTSVTEQPSAANVPTIVGSVAAPFPIQTMQPILPPSSPQTQTSVVQQFPLDSLLFQSDARHRIEVQYSRVPLKIGRDFFDLRLQSNRGGYVYLVLQSSDNESTYIIFPNELDKDNRIKPNQWLQLPRPTWRLRSQGPVGKNRLLVMVTDSPRSLGELRTKPDGPFIKALNDRPSAQALAWLAGTSSNYNTDACRSSGSLGRKDLDYVETCSQ